MESLKYHAPQNIGTLSAKLSQALTQTNHIYLDGVFFTTNSPFCLKMATLAYCNNTRWNTKRRKFAYFQECQDGLVSTEDEMFGDKSDSKIFQMKIYKFPEELKQQRWNSTGTR